MIRRVERHSRWVKRIASHPLHIAAAIQTFFSSDGRSTHAHVEVEDGPRLPDVRFAIVSKSTPYTYLGRLPLEHRAATPGIDTRLSLTAFTHLRRAHPDRGHGVVDADRASSSRAAATSSPLDDLAGILVFADAAVPVSGRRRRRGRHERVDASACVARRAHGRRSPGAAPAIMRSGTFEMIDVDAGRRRARARVVGIVDRPHAHPHTGRVRRARSRPAPRQRPRPRRD